MPGGQLHEHALRERCEALLLRQQPPAELERDRPSEIGGGRYKVGGRRCTPPTAVPQKRLLKIVASIKGDAGCIRKLCRSGRTPHPALAKDRCRDCPAAHDAERLDDAALHRIPG